MMALKGFGNQTRFSMIAPIAVFTSVRTSKADQSLTGTTNSLLSACTKSRYARCLRFGLLR